MNNKGIYIVDGDSKSFKKALGELIRINIQKLWKKELPLIFFPPNKKDSLNLKQIKAIDRAQLLWLSDGGVSVGNYLAQLIKNTELPINKERVKFKVFITNKHYNNAAKRFEKRYNQELNLEAYNCVINADNQYNKKAFLDTAMRELKNNNLVPQYFF